MLVCFDWIFPETWRTLALKNAEIICHVSNLVLPGLAQRAVPINALMNRIFVATANRIGTERDLLFTGNSIIVSPKGEILAKASSENEELIVCEIDINESKNKNVTIRNNIFYDRKPEYYFK